MSAKPEDIICPVCGYYCLGKGGIGCIDKPSMLIPRPTPADVERLKSRITELEDALRWFCGRVEKGEVISKRTYALFKALLDRIGGK